MSAPAFSLSLSLSLTPLLFTYRYTSPPLALVSLGTLPPVFLGARYFGRIIRDRQKHVQELLSESTTVAEETFSNVRTVRQFAAEEHESQRYVQKIVTVCVQFLNSSEVSFQGVFLSPKNTSQMRMSFCCVLTIFWFFFFLLLLFLFLSLHYQNIQVRQEGTGYVR